MNIVTGIVLYAIIWFMTLFVILPIRMQSQDEAGERVAGTHGSAPHDPKLRKRFLWTTGVAFVVWAIIASVILTGVVSVADFDLFSRFGLGSN
jgi:predicted secreted protein